MIEIKIKFQYSVPYDQLLGIMYNKEFSHSQAIVAKDFINKIEVFWQKEGNKIINNVEKTANLKFKSNVDCYVVSNMLFEAISHPFTIKMDHDFNRLKGILVHELLHILFSQNGSKVIETFNKIEGDHDYKVHFPVLLCERKVLEKLNKSFKREKRVEDLDYVWKDVNKSYSKFKNYKKGLIPFMQEHVINE